MKNKLPLIFLFVILLLAAFLRLYHISDYMTFLGDEGRDVLVAKDMLGGNLTLLGPRSSAGDFFMGPAYYYMITPFLWLFRMDPVGPAVMVALFGIATVFLIYFVGKRFFDEKAGLFAAALYAVSPIIITYSHSSWNPNVLPFFSLLLVYMLYKAILAKSSWKYFLFAGFLLGIALQLHYLSLFLGVIAAFYIFFGERYRNKKIHFARTIKAYLQFFAGFLIGFSPFIAFEMRHEYLNTKALVRFVFGGTAQIGHDSGMNFIQIVSDVFFRIFAKLVFFFPSPDRYDLFQQFALKAFGVTVIVLAIAAALYIFCMKNKLAKLGLIAWLFLGVLLFGFYRQFIFDYHFAFLFPLPFLLIGNLFSQLQNKKGVWFKLLAITLFAAAFLYNLYGMPFRYAPNRQKDQVKKISEFVLSQAHDRPFNFALITGGNSDHAYRYYFEINNHRPVVIENDVLDPQRKTVTDQLLVVCEDTNCQPVGNPLWEVSGFGRAEIAGKWDVSVVKVYRLVHYKETGGNR